MNIEISNTRARIKEAQENLTYWRRQKILRTVHTAQVDAGARILLWESQLRALKEKLAALQSTQPATA